MGAEYWYLQTTPDEPADDAPTETGPGPGVAPVEGRREDGAAGPVGAEDAGGPARPRPDAHGPGRPRAGGPPDGRRRPRWGRGVGREDVGPRPPVGPTTPPAPGGVPEVVPPQGGVAPTRGDADTVPVHTVRGLVGKGTPPVRPERVDIVAVGRRHGPVDVRRLGPVRPPGRYVPAGLLRPLPVVHLKRTTTHGPPQTGL